MGRIYYKLKILMSKLILNPQGDLFVIQVGSLKNIYLSTHELGEGSLSRTLKYV